MIKLTTSTSTIRVVTSATCTVDVHADWFDEVDGSTNTAITTATTTAVVAAPSAASGRSSLVKNVLALSVANKHASTSVIVQVQVFDGTTAFQLVSETLYAGDSLVYLSGVGWSTVHTQAAGIAGTSLGQVCNIPIGNTAYGSLGTSGVHTAGTMYYSEIFLPANKTITGIACLNGATDGTDKLIFALASSTGAVLATTALAGVTSSGTDAFQQIALTATYDAIGPARYFVILQCNGTTATTRKIAASTFRNWASSVAGVFGTIAAITPPTSTVADKGPIAYVY